MSWWLILLLGYLAVCWTTWIVIAWIGRNQTESDHRGGASSYGQFPVRYWISIALTALFLSPLLPLYAAHCLWAAVRESSEWRKFGRTFRETTPEPVHPANVPAAAQEHIERCSPVLVLLGFVPAGTYRLKPEPLQIYAQCLLSRTGETVADISLIGDSTSVSFVSVLENGHVLETSCSGEPLSDEELRPINESGRYTSQMFPGGSGSGELEFTYRSHLETLARLENHFGCGTLHLASDQVPVLKRYENSVFGEVLFDQGKVDNRPQPPQIPLGVAKRISPWSAPCSTPNGVVLPSAPAASAPLYSPLV
jgi:hypothetical protein